MYIIVFMHKKLNQYLFLYIGPKIYDELSLDIKQCNAIKLM